MATATYEPIAAHTVSGTTNRVTFSNLPATFKDVVIVFDGKMAVNTAYIDFEFNSDTTDSNYPYILAQGNGSSTYTEALTNNNNGPFINNSAAGFTLNLLDYSSTSHHKTGLWRSDTPGTMTQMGALRWASNNAINSIAFYDSSGEAFASGCKFAIYGIRG